MLVQSKNSEINNRKGCALLRKDLLRRAAVTASAIFTFIALAQAHAEVYKYTEDGSITYGDRASMSPSDSGHSVLNSQGVVLKKVLSREERRQAARKQAEQDQMRLRDKTLLDTFTTEEDLLRTREDRLGLIDGQMNQLNDRIKQLNERKLVVMEKIQGQEESKGAGNAATSQYEELANIDSKVENMWGQKDAKTQERKAVELKFDSDLQRYRELKVGG